MADNLSPQPQWEKIFIQRMSRSIAEQDTLIEKARKINKTKYPATPAELAEVYLKGTFPDIPEVSGPILEERLKNEFGEDYVDEAGTRDKLKNDLEKTVKIKHRRNIQRIYDAITFFGTLIQDERDMKSQEFIKELEKTNKTFREDPSLSKFKFKNWASTLEEIVYTFEMPTEVKGCLEILIKYFRKDDFKRKKIKRNLIREIIIYREFKKFGGNKLKVPYLSELVRDYHWNSPTMGKGRPSNLLRNALIRVVYQLLVESNGQPGSAKQLTTNLLISHLCLELTTKAVDGIIRHHI